jgi:hypothetical protein
MGAGCLSTQHIAAQERLPNRKLTEYRMMVGIWLIWVPVAFQPHRNIIELPKNDRQAFYDGELP